MPKRLTTYQRFAQRSKAARAERTKAISRLKRAGLVSGRSNLKSSKVRAGLLVKYRDVIARKAAVVKLPRGLITKQLKQSFRVSGLNVVIPHKIGERVRIEKSTGLITSTRVFKGQRIKRIIVVNNRIPKARKGKKMFFSITFSGDRKVRFDSYKKLEEFMNGDSYVNTFKNWREYLEVDEIDVDDEGGEDE